ncbi:MAG: hypothetical protein JWM56_1257 [Candidatus Peribacteria bacterium]|nr:hypothetical protein [Candidatus Peribacteria bacterium]
MMMVWVARDHIFWCVNLHTRRAIYFNESLPASIAMIAGIFSGSRFEDTKSVLESNSFIALASGLIAVIGFRVLHKQSTNDRSM